MADLLTDFLIGEWRISPKLNRVANDDGSVRLKRKSMEVLCVLAKANGEPVTREEFMDAVWPRMAVTDDVLTQSIAELRRAFGDDARNPSVIETIPRIGFRLVVPVGTIEDDQPDAKRFFSSPVLVAASIVTIVASAWIILAKDKAERDSVLLIDEPPSIAVLPFDNIGGGPENEDFTEGLTEELRTSLGQVSGLKVIGRTSSQVFKDTHEDVRVIGDTLGVRAVLEGSVRKSGEQIRVTAQLIDVVDGSQIWSSSYDRQLTELFSVQDDVANAIIDNLEIHVGQAPTRGQLTSSGDAYTFYLQAKAAVNAFNFDEARRLSEAALDADPEFGEAQELLAFISWYKPRSLFHLADEQQELLVNAAKALALDPELPLANAFFEGTRIDGYSFYREFEAYERAANALPNNPVVLTTYFFYLMQSGYINEANTVATQQMDIEPLAALSYVNRYTSRYAAGQFEESEAAIRVVQEMRGGVVPWQVGDAHMSRGEYERAASIFDAFIDNEGVYDYLDIGSTILNALKAEDRQGYLDHAITEILNTVPDDHTFLWSQSLMLWYLHFGYVDRYVEITLERQPGQAVWTGRADDDLLGHYLPPQRFYWASEVLEIARKAGLVEVWERRGPPDFCAKSGADWVCE